MTGTVKERFLDAVNKYWEKILDKSPGILIGLAILIIFILLAIFVRRAIRNIMHRRIGPNIVVSFASQAVFLLILVIGIVIFLRQIGLGGAAGGLLAGAGVSALVIGFAFKDIGENFLAGFFLAFSRPFGVGDVIEIEGTTGTVKTLNFRNTHIRTFDGKDVFVPNAMLIKNVLTNFTRDGLLRHDFVVGLDYGDDIKAAIALVMDKLASFKEIEHNNQLKPFILIQDFGTSTINLKIFFWTDSASFEGNTLILKTEIMRQIQRALAAEGYSMPADIVELKIYQKGDPIPLRMMGDDNEV